MQKTTPTAERRLDTRMEFCRPAKIRCPATGHYYRGQISNLSQGGMLLQMQDPSNLKPGQTVYVGVAWTPRTAILQTSDMMGATVVRSLSLKTWSYLALKLEKSHVLAASA